MDQTNIGKSPKICSQSYFHILYWIGLQWLAKVIWNGLQWLAEVI